jgi:aspartate/methionine/tyrosine aminotransferase
VNTAFTAPVFAPLADRNRIWRQSLAVDHAARADGQRTIDLAQGYLREMPPAHVIAAAQQAMERGETHYVDHAGLAPLREALAAHISQAGEPALEPGELLVTSGAQEALFVTLRALVQPGDQVLVADPGYTPVQPVIELAGGTVVHVPATPALDFSAAQLAECISPATRFVVLFSPNPATARAVAPREYANLLALAEQHKLVVVLDAALEHGMYQPSWRPSPAHSSRLILIGSVSKLWRMSGWRIGWIAARSEVIQTLKTFKQMLSICSSSISQWATLAALSGPQQWLVEQQTELARRRDAAVEVLATLGLPAIQPHAAPFILFDIRRTHLTSEQFADRALAELQVAVTPGTAFGAPGEGYVRLALTQPEFVLRDGLQRLARLAGSSASLSREDSGPSKGTGA